MSRWQRKLSERDEGFSLVELVVAMFILGIVLIALIGVQISAMITISDSSRTQQATAYANEAMETLRAMPWDTLNKGNVPNFNTAGGNTDPYFTGGSNSGTVTVDGETYTVRFASTNTQNLGVPRPPLFDSSGSNHVVMSDPAKPDFKVDVRAYIVNSLDGSAGSVGLLVIASWKDAKHGTTREIALRSSAYPGSSGCGDLATQPYLVSCQDRFMFSSASGYVSTSLSATPPNSTDLAPVIEGSTLQEISVRAAYVTARGESVQVSQTGGKVSRGGVTERDMPLSGNTVGPSTERGYTEIATLASDNFAVSGGPPADQIETIGSASSTATSILSGLWKAEARSDDGRSGSSRSSTTQACLGSQLVAGSPCAYTTLAGSAELKASLSFDTQTMFPMLRSGSATSTAGGGRFVATKPGTMFGCQTLGSSGCASAAATYAEGSIKFGAFASGAWVESPTYLVEIANYSDSVLAQRGSMQASTAPTMTRSGTVRFWNGSSYATVALNETSTGVLAQSGTVTWSPGAGITVTASAAVSATPVSVQTLGEVPVVTCSTDACATSATAGSVTVNLRYQVVTPTGAWDIYQSSVITGSAASASFEKRS